jgi:hypothetical protein
MGLKSFNSEGNVTYLSFSQKYGMLMKGKDRDMVKKIEGKWKAEENFVVENTTPFSPELQRKMADALRKEGVEPIRSLDGVFESLTNTVLKYKVGNTDQESEQISLIISDGDEKFTISIDRDSESAALLALGVVDNMQLGGFYELAIYNKMDQQGYKRTHVMIKNRNGELLRDQNSQNFKAYVTYIQQGRSKGVEWAMTQGLVEGSRDYKQIVAQTISRFRANFVKQLVERAALKGPIQSVPSFNEDDDLGQIMPMMNHAPQPNYYDNGMGYNQNHGQQNMRHNPQGYQQQAPMNPNFQQQNPMEHLNYDQSAPSQGQGFKPRQGQKINQNQAGYNAPFELNELPF